MVLLMITFSNQDTVMMKQYERSKFVIAHCSRRFREVVVLSVCLDYFISETEKKIIIPFCLKLGSRL
jgi:hypothetical protein